MLPTSWKPRNSHGLIRVGPNEDGGYVIPKIILDKTSILFGLGVNDDWRFEADFKQRSGCEVVCYDHTVTAKFWRRRFKKGLMEFILLRRLIPRKIFDIFKYFPYKRFFNGKNAVHHKIMIGYDMPGATSIDGIIKTYNRKDGIFFKIDIEGSEYRVIEQLKNYPDIMVGFVIEFHDIDIHRDRISKFITELDRYQLVHIHANNVAEKTDGNGDPVTVEMSFLRDDLVENHHEESTSYPIIDLDYPNSSKDKDLPLKFEKI